MLRARTGEQRPRWRGAALGPVVCAVALALGGARATDDLDACARMRAGSRKLLIVMPLSASGVVDTVHAGALHRAGWEVGFVMWGSSRTHYSHAHARSKPRAIVAERDGARALSYLTYLRAQPSHEALAEEIGRFKPALVVSPALSTLQLLDQTRRALEREPASAASRDAALRLRCSLPRPTRAVDPETNSTRALRKIGTLVLAQRAGARMPFTVHVPPAGLPDAIASYAARHAPVYVKSDVDGGGRGVRRCDSAACVRSALGKLRGAEGMVQGSVRGHLVAVLGVSLDGVVLGSFVRISVLQLSGRHSAPLVQTSVTHADALQQAATLVGALGVSGVWAVDYMISADDGLAYLIDPGLRFNTNALVDGDALGLQTGLAERLLAAVRAGSARAAAAHGAARGGGALEPAAALPHSLTFARFSHSALARGIAPALYCADVFVPLPAGMGRTLTAVSQGGLELDESGCALRSGSGAGWGGGGGSRASLVGAWGGGAGAERERGDGARAEPGERRALLRPLPTANHTAAARAPALPQRCRSAGRGPCAGRCAPLAVHAPALTVPQAVAQLCSREWLIAHTSYACAAPPAERAGARGGSDGASVRALAARRPRQALTSSKGHERRSPTRHPRGPSRSFAHCSGGRLVCRPQAAAPDGPSAPAADAGGGGGEGDEGALQPREHDGDAAQTAPVATAAARAGGAMPRRTRRELAWSRGATATTATPFACTAVWSSEDEGEDDHDQHDDDDAASVGSSNAADAHWDGGHGRR